MVGGGVYVLVGVADEGDVAEPLIEVVERAGSGGADDTLGPVL